MADIEVMSDNFNGSHDDALDTYSSNWTVIVANIRIQDKSGNFIAASGDGGWNHYLWNPDTFAADQYAVATMYYTGSYTSGRYIGPSVRVVSSSGFNGYAAVVDVTGAIVLVEGSSGSISTLSSSNEADVVTNDLLELRAEGTSLIINYQGSESISDTDATHDGTSSEVGLSGFSSTQSYLGVDDMVAGDIVPDGAGLLPGFKNTNKFRHMIMR